MDQIKIPQNFLKELPVTAPKLIIASVSWLSEWSISQRRVHLSNKAPSPEKSCLEFDRRVKKREEEEATQGKKQTNFPFFVKKFYIKFK